MKLLELFGKPSNYRITKQSNTEFHVEVEIDAQPMSFVAERVSLSMNSWIIEFGRVDELGRVRFGFTERGQAGRVMGFVKHALELFIRHYQPTKFFFAAYSGRAELYQRMIERFNVPGYDYETVPTEDGTKFRFVRHLE